MEKIFTDYFLVNFEASGMFSSCLENPKKLHVKGFSLKSFMAVDCSHQTTGFCKTSFSFLHSFSGQ
jgi:hypothetical protein